MTDFTTTKLEIEYQKVLKQLERVNKICFQQEDEILFLRKRLDEIVEKCNDQAYQIHNLEQSVQVERERNEECCQRQFLEEDRNRKGSVLKVGEKEVQDEENGVKIRSRKEVKGLNGFLEEVSNNRTYSRLLTLREESMKILNFEEQEKKELEAFRNIKKENWKLRHERDMLEMRRGELQKEVLEKNKTPMDLFNE